MDEDDPRVRRTRRNESVRKLAILSTKQLIRKAGVNSWETVWLQREISLGGPYYDGQVKPKPERIHLKHSGSFYKDLSNKSSNSMAWICFIWQA
jgi:hypothetical protein